MSAHELISEIDEFLSKWPDLSVSTFGILAVNDGKFVPEIKAGRRIWPETEERVRSFMRDYRPGERRRAHSGIEAAAQ